MNSVYKVCIPQTKRDCFDYLSSHLKPCIGARVWVPFGKQKRLGIVLAIGEAEKAHLILKEITEVIDDTALLPDEILRLCRWISHYYQTPLSEVLPLALPKVLRLGKPCLLPTRVVYELSQPLAQAKISIPARARKQQELVEILHTCSLSKQEILEKGFSASQIQSLHNAKIIRQTEAPKTPKEALEPAPDLNPEQTKAVVEIVQHLNQYQCFLLQGVTGSGKTEVYLQVIAKVLDLGKQVLIIVPEIGLTPQLLRRFTARFHEPMAVLHSNLNESQRQQTWICAKNNQIKLLIGTRSSVFTPLPNLGLIVIDEEHDASLKQMEGLRYSARDTALMRAYWANIPIILGSATPSLESLLNHKKNKYRLLRLNHKALTSTPLQYQLIDLRAKVLTHGFCAQTLSIIKEHLANKNQVLVFINRRGFAPVLLCHACGFMVDCRACDSHLTWHKTRGQLICHHCGLHQAPPRQCPSCHHQEFIPVGAGTQRIQEYLSQQFPDTTILRVDRDEVRKKNALNAHLDLINTGEAQLIVGTQMLAKGHHFPGLTLVVVVDADAGLYNQDFKALEQLGQLLTQVAGRAGRAEFPGQVLIQTHLPNHPLLNVLIQEGYDAFAQALLQSRLQAGLPPYQFLALIRAQGKSIEQLTQFLQTAKKLVQDHPIQVMGPAQAPLARKANQYRMQLLIKSESRLNLGTALSDMRKALGLNKLSQAVRWSVDVDPMDLS